MSCSSLSTAWLRKVSARGSASSERHDDCANAGIEARGCQRLHKRAHYWVMFGKKCCLVALAAHEPQVQRAMLPSLMLTQQPELNHLPLHRRKSLAVTHNLDAPSRAHRVHRVKGIADRIHISRMEALENLHADERLYLWWPEPSSFESKQGKGPQHPSCSGLLMSHADHVGMLTIRSKAVRELGFYSPVCLVTQNFSRTLNRQRTMRISSSFGTGSSTTSTNLTRVLVTYLWRARPPAAKLWLPGIIRRSARSEGAAAFCACRRLGHTLLARETLPRSGCQERRTHT